MEEKIKAPDVSRIWQLYEHGLEAHSAINLEKTVTRNERFYVGDQWHGINAPNLPKPSINFIKRACQQKVESVSKNPPKVQFFSADLPSNVVTPDAVAQNNQLVAAKAEYIQEREQNPNAEIQNEDVLVSEADAQKLTAMFEVDWNRLKLNHVLQDGLLDACISGNLILYNYWDADADIHQASKGQIEVELIDNVNFFPTDIQERNVQKQPSIIISRRELLSKVIDEARANGATEEDIKKLTADRDTYNQAGDMSRIELQDKFSEKITTLYYFWRDKKTKHIFAAKVTKNVVIWPAKDTMLTRYPFACMSWELRKNSFYGRPEVSGLIPNQVTVNRIYAMTALSVIENAYPRVIYSKAAIDHWSNDIMQPIEVNSNDINNVVRYLNPPTIANDAYSLPEKLMRSTLEMMGANDVALGNVNPVNSSAFAMAAQQAQIPNDTIRKRFYSMVEDFARNWLDMTLAYIKTSRWVEIRDDYGNSFTVDFEPKDFRNKVWNVSVKVGADTEWNPNDMLQNMANWLQSGAIDFIQYLEMLPESQFPYKQKLLKDAKLKAQQMQEQAMQLAQQQLESKMPQLMGQQADMSQATAQPENQEMPQISGQSA